MTKNAGTICDKLPSQQDVKRLEECPGPWRGSKRRRRRKVGAGHQSSPQGWSRTLTDDTDASSTPPSASNSSTFVAFLFFVLSL
jgi:hypothetical protein